MRIREKERLRNGERGRERGDRERNENMNELLVSVWRTEGKLSIRTKP